MPTKAAKEKGKRDSSVLDAYQQHLPALKRFIGGIISNPSDIEDMAQEAFLKAYAAEKKKSIENPKSYLFRTSRNAAISHLREKKRKATDYIEDYDQLSVIEEGSSVEEELIANQTIGMHCEAVAKLPPRCRQIYLLRKVYGMSYKDIANTLDISVSTVESQLEKGFARCNDYINSRNANNLHQTTLLDQSTDAEEK
jgi:RNA polymerase sigma-70 factor (ECF subfamily)